MTLEIVFVILLILAMGMALAPGIPAVPVMGILILVYAFLDDFTHIAPWHLLVFAGLAVASLGVDFFSGLIGAKFGKSGKKALLYGAVGLVIGLLLFPPFGALLGLFVGVFVAEIVDKKRPEQALRAASFSLIGATVGAVVNTLLAIGTFVGFLVIVIP